MKKRIISLTLAVMMIAATLIGCGNDTTKDETNVTPNTEVTTETPTPETDVPEVDVPETEVGDSEVDVENFFKDAYSLEFPTGMTGFTDKYVFSSDETWSLNDTHYVDANGNVMDFEWEGPTELGESAGTNDITLNLLGGDYELDAWYGGELGLTTMDELNEIASMDKSIWYACTTAEIVENGYYNVERKDNIAYITFEVKTNGKIGYAHFLANGETNDYYMFMYLEKETIFDETRAMKVVNSIKYWDYEPKNE